jgi:hypothetical protein
MKFATKRTNCMELLERSPDVRTLDSFSASYGTRRFNTEFARALHLSLSWARPMQSTSPHPISTKSILILSIYVLVFLVALSLWLSHQQPILGDINILYQCVTCIRNTLSVIFKWNLLNYTHVFVLHCMHMNSPHNNYRDILKWGVQNCLHGVTCWRIPAIKIQLTSSSESASELYRPREGSLPAKLVPNFTNRGCHMDSVTVPLGRILGFLNRN